MANMISAGESREMPDGADRSARLPLPAITELSNEVGAATALARDGKRAESREMSSIVSRTDLRIAAVNELTRVDPERKGVASVSIDKETARNWANLDTVEFSRMRSEERKSVALDAIAGHLRVVPQYAEALEQRSPAIATAAKAINVEVERLEQARESAAVEMQRLGEIEERRAARLAAIDANALAIVGQVREQQVAEVTARLRRDPDPVLDKTDIRDAQRAIPDSVNRGFGGNGRSQASVENEAAVAEKLRVLKRPVLESELPQSIRTRFIVAKKDNGIFEPSWTEFAYRAGRYQGELAFTDAGKQLITQSDQREIVVAMLEVAKAKNWSEITVSGSDVFRRQAWLEGRMAGMDVRGYEARDVDQQLLQDLQRGGRATNRMVVADRDRVAPQEVGGTAHAQQDGVHIDGDALTANERAGMRQAREILTNKGLDTAFSAAALAQVEEIARGQRVYAGTVVEHGAANYRFDATRDRSYFVTLETPEGRKTIWGKGLENAVADGKVQPGDAIVLRNPSTRAVTVQEPVRDTAGKITGVRDKAARFNEWTAQSLAQNRTQAQSAATLSQQMRQATAPERGDRTRGDHGR